jgi:SpoVK/Ycf46/Vps4 family AAA+-type ATPase
MLRPGRFDKRVYVGPPDEAARHALFELFLHTRPHADDVDLEALVKQTEGFSNADIEEVVKEAARIAAVQDAHKITQRFLLEAVKAIPSSLKPMIDASASPLERRRFGFHPPDESET